MGERMRGFWRRRTEGLIRKVALIEPGTLTPSPVIAVEEGGERRAARRLELLAGLLSRGGGDTIDP